VAAAVSLVNRSGGEGASLPVPLHSLMKIDVPTYAPADCPLCAGGSTAVKPGSR
jgi:orotate phosphoribosyltransferase